MKQTITTCLLTLGITYNAIQTTHTGAHFIINPVQQEPTLHVPQTNCKVVRLQWLSHRNKEHGLSYVFTFNNNNCNKNITQTTIEIGASENSKNEICAFKEYSYAYTVPATSQSITADSIRKLGVNMDRELEKIFCIAEQTYYNKTIAIESFEKPLEKQKLILRIKDIERLKEMLTIERVRRWLLHPIPTPWEPMFSALWGIPLGPTIVQDGTMLPVFRQSIIPQPFPQGPILIHCKIELFRAWTWSKGIHVPTEVYKLVFNHNESSGAIGKSTVNTIMIDRAYINKGSPPSEYRYEQSNNISSTALKFDTNSPLHKLMYYDQLKQIFDATAEIYKENPTPELITEQSIKTKMLIWPIKDIKKLERQLTIKNKPWSF